MSKDNKEKPSDDTVVKSQSDDIKSEDTISTDDLFDAFEASQGAPDGDPPKDVDTKDGSSDSDTKETDEGSSDSESDASKDEPKDDIPKFYPSQAEEGRDSDMAKVAQIEYDKRQEKDASKNLEKENRAYREIFERFKTSPLPMLREMYGDDVVTQLQTLETDDATGGLKQSNRAMAQRIEKLEKERETDFTARETLKHDTEKQESVQAEVVRYTGVLEDLSSRDEFQLAREYCKHQELDLTTEASIFAGQIMDNQDKFVEPIEALRGIQSYVEKLKTFNTSQSDPEDTEEKPSKDSPPKDKVKTLKNSDNQDPGGDKTEVDGEAAKQADIDRLFDQFEQKNNY